MLPPPARCHAALLLILPCHLCPCGCSKVEAAEELVTTLLDGSQAEATAATEADVAALPPLVRAHYLRSLLDWSCAALTKKAGAPPASGDGGGKPAKKRKQQQAQQADGSHAAAELRPRCWAVLTAVLGSSSTAASQPLPAALLPAATTAMQGLQEGAQSGQQGTQLLAQLAALLGLLHGKFAGGFRPSIEHAAAAVEAALTGHAAAAAGEGQQQAWEPVAVAAVRLLLAAAAGHPNQRKVWDAAVPRLLPLLAQAAFPALTSSSTGSGELPACCRQLLGMLLFHHQHVAALAEAAAAEMAAAVAEASATGKDAGQPDSGEAALSHQQQRQGGSYAVQLFVTMRAQVAAAQLPLPLLPWMAGQFCAALRQHRRAAETGKPPPCCCLLAMPCRRPPAVVLPTFWRSAPRPCQLSILCRGHSPSLCLQRRQSPAKQGTAISRSSSTPKRREVRRAALGPAPSRPLARWQRHLWAAASACRATSISGWRCCAR